MWLETRIISWGERKLKPYREEAHSVSGGLAEVYTQHLSQIEMVYGKVTHWHGTGRYHYRHQEGSRYAGLQEDGTVDVLSAIIAVCGLVPHKDPWIDSGCATVSLATVRMHARGFACLYLYEGDAPLLYELGSRRFWFRLYASLLFVWLCADIRGQLPFIRSLFRRSFLRDAYAWLGALRKQSEKKKISLSALLCGDIPVSDIEGNYPLLFGVAVASSDLIETIPLTHKVEQRSTKRVTLAECTHIEVPYAYVAETKRILLAKDINIPVIPLECGDLYLASQPLVRLAYS